MYPTSRHTSIQSRSDVKADLQIIVPYLDKIIFNFELQLIAFAKILYSPFNRPGTAGPRLSAAAAGASDASVPVRRTGLGSCTRSAGRSEEEASPSTPTTNGRQRRWRRRTRRRRRPSPSSGRRNLSDARFALFAVGDRAYGPNAFCIAGRKLAARLVQLGARLVCPIGCALRGKFVSGASLGARPGADSGPG